MQLPRRDASRYRRNRVLTLAAYGPFGNSPAKSGATATSPAKTAPDATDFLVDGGISGAYVTPL